MQVFIIVDMRAFFSIQHVNDGIAESVDVDRLGGGGGKREEMDVGRISVLK